MSSVACPSSSDTQWYDCTSENVLLPEIMISEWLCTASVSTSSLGIIMSVSDCFSRFLTARVLSAGTGDVDTCTK